MFLESLGASTTVIAVAAFILKSYFDRRIGKAGEIAGQLEKLGDLKKIHEEIKNIDHGLAKKLEAAKSSLGITEKVIDRKLDALEIIVERNSTLISKQFDLIALKESHADTNAIDALLREIVNYNKESTSLFFSKILYIDSPILFEELQRCTDNLADCRKNLNNPHKTEIHMKEAVEAFLNTVNIIRKDFNLEKLPLDLSDLSS